MPRWTSHGVLLAAVGLSSALHATAVGGQELSPFLRERGGGIVALSSTVESYDSFWKGTTRVAEPALGEVRTRSLALWAAYGLTDDLSLFASLPFVDSEGAGSAGLSQRALQDLSLMLAYRVAESGSRVRSELIGGLGLRAPASSYDPDLPVSVGDGTTDALVRFAYLVRYGNLYLASQVGYDLRGGSAPDGLLLFTEAGVGLGRATVSGYFGSQLADGGSDIGDPGFTFPGNQEEWERIGARVHLRISPRFGLAVSGFSTLSGRNTGDASGLSLGFDVGFR